MRSGLAVLVLFLLLGGCGKTQLAPVSDRSISARSAPERTGRTASPAARVSERSVVAPVATVPTYHRVQKGETLYSISWRYRLDFRRVARLNRIDRDYVIHPGQRLRLKGSLPATVAAKPQRTPVKTAAQKSSGQAVAKKSVPVPSATKLSNRVAVSGNQSVNSTAKVAKPATDAKHKNSPKVSSTSSSSKSVKVGSIRWQWPAKGRVIEAFRTRGRVNKGINIAGRRGEPVYAAASGEVVYAGNGLLGYGNLVIINHNGLYMSAYAHSSRVFVKERDRVSRGDRIAEIGSSGTDRHMLHFEIRRDGNPVNPVKYLPKR